MCNVKMIWFFLPLSLYYLLVCDGQLMQVDLVKRHLFSVYWNGEDRRVLRGHWFARKGGVDWLPLREDVAEQLEVAYRRQVCENSTIL